MSPIYFIFSCRTIDRGCFGLSLLYQTMTNTSSFPMISSLICLLVYSRSYTRFIQTYSVLFSSSQPFERARRAVNLLYIFVSYNRQEMFWIAFFIPNDRKDFKLSYDIKYDMVPCVFTELHMLQRVAVPHFLRSSEPAEPRKSQQFDWSRAVFSSNQIAIFKQIAFPAPKT